MQANEEKPTFFILFGQQLQQALPQLKILLQNCGLPVSDLFEDKEMLFVALQQGNTYVACAGVELHDNLGLLRSVAVDPAFRNQGLASKLLTELTNISTEKGVQQLHLLTTTAEKYFLTKGFCVEKRENAPAAIGATIEFSSLCPASSVYMTMPIL